MKEVVRNLFRAVGLEVSRKPRHLPFKRVGELGLYSTPQGAFLLPLDAPRDIILERIKTGTVFEPEVVEVAERYIKPGSVALDLGANFGQMTMLMSRLTGPTGRVYSFEAQRSVYDILIANLENNGIQNVTPVFGAVFNEADREFHFPAPDFKRFAAYGSYNVPLGGEDGERVTSVVIDDMTFDRPISFMKVDIQGCDLFGMQGARKTIAEHRMPIIFEFEQRFQNEYGTTFQDYVKFVDEIGYYFAETVLDINYVILPK